MSRSSVSGFILTAEDIDDLATRIAEMWDNYNIQRRVALSVGEEARQYMFATDINTTSASILPHKNRTHMPKMTELSDNLQSQYWDATMSTPEWFRFEGVLKEDKDKAIMIESWVRSKLEFKRFRETTGRQLLADYVIYGNAFARVDYIREVNDDGILVYQGPVVERVSPLDIVFNPQAMSFRKSPKIERKLIHVAEVANWPDLFPNYPFSREKINKAIEVRQGDTLDDWVEVLKERGITFDGFSTFNDYFKQDLVEVLIYRGDIFDPASGETQRDRVVYIIDRVFVILNNRNTAPAGFDTYHHAGWRLRNDNLWGQGPLDNLISMQYRIDHLENLKADIFDLIAHPVLKVTGEGVQIPEEGYAPGAVYYLGIDEDVEAMPPDTTALNANTEIQLYHTYMEQFAGAPPETRGIRTPGEKTAFEVNKLDANATKMFVDKARSFEMLLEGMLQEVFLLMIQNFDSVDFIEIFNDVSGQREIEEIILEDVNARGRFTALGSRHWNRRNRETVEMRDFQLGPMQDPKIRAHVDGLKLAEFYEKRLNLEEENIIEPFAGIKEDIQIAAIAKGEAEQLGGIGSGEEGQGPQSAGESPLGVIEQLQPGQGRPRSPESGSSLV